jgi:hypothetical protein
VTGPPDFVGVGAQRSGTTWWYGVVTAHPEVTAQAEKELQFFGRLSPERRRDPDLAALYASYFPRRPGTVTGEWTPGVMVAARRVEQLAVVAPHARVLVLLRDPLERLRSGVNRVHQLAARRGEPPPSEEDLARQLRHSLYGEQLERLRARFEHVLVLQYERCVADPRGEAERTWRFLGLDPAEVEPALVEATPNRRRHTVALDPGFEAAAREAITADRPRVAAAAPELDLGLWPVAAG